MSESVETALRDEAVSETTSGETLLEDHAGSPELASLRERAEHGPEHIGRYQLLAKLGSGGFATVFLARLEGAAGFGRFVAIKRIHDHLASERELVAMFLDEARVASAIDHPNVCAPLDFGRTDEGTYFLAMDYLLGEPLSEVRRAYGRVHGAPRPEDVAFVLRVLADAAHGLHAAHEALDARGRPLEIVHRDVAPANLFVLFSGHVKVVDFGIAKAARKLHTTQHGVFKGHVPFAAPEQLRGRSLDRRADLWSLGVVLWEMLAKRRLFPQKDEVALVDAIVRDRIPELRERAPWVSPRLAALVHRCLSRDPEGRPSSALELALGLEEELRRVRVPMGAHEVGAYLHALLPDRARTRYRQLWGIAEEAGFARSSLTSLELEPSEISERRPVPVAGAAVDDESEPDATIPLPAPHFEDVTGDPDVAGHVRDAVSQHVGAQHVAQHVEGELASEPAVERARSSPSTPVMPVELDAFSVAAPPSSELPPLRGRFGRAAVAAAIFIAAVGLFTLGRLSAPRAVAPMAATPIVPSPIAPVVPPSPAAVVEPVAEHEPPASARPEPRRRGSAGRTARRGTGRAVVGRGFVSVTASGGWGEVFVGRQRLGVTPGRFELPAGPTTLRVVPPTGRARTVRVVIPTDGEARVRVELAEE